MAKFNTNDLIRLARTTIVYDANNRPLPVQASSRNNKLHFWSLEVDELIWLVPDQEVEMTSEGVCRVATDDEPLDLSFLNPLLPEDFEALLNEKTRPLVDFDLADALPERRR